MMMLPMKLFPKDKINLFRKEKVIKTTNQISLGLLLFTLLLLAIFWRKLPPEIPLFYSLPWGEEQLGPPSLLLAFIFSGFSLGIINFILGLIFFEKYPLAAKILAYITTSVGLLLTITVFKIIFLVT